MEMARAHVNRYYRTETYDQHYFMARADNLDLNTAREVTRAELRNRRTEQILDSGIYLIVAENNETVYVGLANNFYSRFTTGQTVHNDDCSDDCAHFGHFVNPTEGSRRVGMPEGNCRYFILEYIEHEGFGISQAEIDWYYLFVANGWQERDSNRNRRVTNHRPSLGMKGRELSPCVVVTVSSGEHGYFLGQNDAGHLLGMEVPGSKVLGPSISHYKNQQNGYTARHATLDEIEFGTVVGERDVIWRVGQSGQIVEDMADVCPGCAGNGEHSKRYRMFWNSGPLSEMDIAHLNGTRRRVDGEGYGEEIPQSDYRQVSWDSNYNNGLGGWQARAKSGPTGTNADLWRAGPNRNIETEDQAALIRELAILENGYQTFCRGRFTGSNAALLNERLSLEERGGMVFVDWEEE